MKLAKGVVFFFLIIALESCFNPPEFPIEPQIDFQDIVFKKSSGAAKDSLILTITFKDGDGDLGVDGDNTKYSDYPFHPINYFLAKNGELLTISTFKPFEDIPAIFKVDNGQSGKLASIRTRNETGYEDLPEFNCYNYTYDSVYVQEADKDIFDNSYYLKKIIPEVQGVHPTIYHLLDTFYIEKNTNHYNITLDFQIRNSNGTYTDYDLEKETCDPVGFDGRFPILTESKVPLEGTLRYSMESSGLSIAFQGKTLRLKVQIKDRALHLSNSVYTKDFMIN
ncbi:MAG: hypothetical protein ABI663_21375 [Chryseolinea sp.]